MTEKKVDVAIIGAGSAGLSAASEVRKKTDRFLVINGGPYGTTCARVGCMPSKVLIHAADDFHRRHTFAEAGISGGESLAVDTARVMQYVRSLRDFYVSSVLEGLSGRPALNMTGYARFIEPTVLDVEGTIVRAEKVIIATGSRPVVPGFWQDLQPWLITSDDIFELEDLPSSIAVVGLGVIGIELGQALSRLGVDVVGLDLLETVAGISDPVILTEAKEILQREFPLWLGEKAELTEENGRVRVRSGDRSRLVDRVLLSMGRRPNLDGLGLEEIGVPMDERKLPIYDRNTMQIDGMPIYIAGDVVVEKAILHEASDEGRIAGYNAVHDVHQKFKRRTPIGICFSDPNIGFAGYRYSEIEEKQPIIGEVSFKSQGRSRAMRANEGHARLYACPDSYRLLGAEMIAPAGEHMIQLLTWSMQMKTDIFDLLRMPYYHPVVEEGLRTAIRSMVSQVGEKSGEFELSDCDGSCIDALC